MASYSVRYQYSGDALGQTFHRWPARRSKKWETAAGTTLQYKDRFINELTSKPCQRISVHAHVCAIAYNKT